MRAACVFAAFVVMVGPADAQQCRADFDGSGAVEVNELITAVNEALSGCRGSLPTPTRTKRGARTPTPTPTLSTPVTPTATRPTLTGCPVLFTDDNTGDEAPVCRFAQLRGANIDCPGIPYDFYSDGALVILVEFDDTGTGYYGATVTDADHAVIFGRWTKDDLSDYRNALGTLRLWGNGERLSVEAHPAACDSLAGRYDETRFPARPAIRVAMRALHARR